MTVDINGDIWSAMFKLETSSHLKYGKESSEETTLGMKCSFSLFWAKVGLLNILENLIFYDGLQHKSQRGEDLEFQIKTETDCPVSVISVG